MTTSDPPLPSALDLSAIRSLTDVGSMTRLLHETIARERSIEAELEALLAERSEVERKLFGLQTAGEVLELVRTDADAMLSSVSSTCSLAEHVSSKVRELDLAQSRVHETLSKIDTIVERTNCIVGAKSSMEAGDYEGAAKCIQTFVQLEEQMAAMGVAAVGGSGMAAEGAADTAAEQRRQLLESKAQLEEVVRREFSAAAEERNQMRVERFARLFAPIGLQEEGVRSLVGYLRKVVAARAREAYDLLIEGLEERFGDGAAAGGVAPGIVLPADFVETLTSLYRDIALAVEGNEGVLRDIAGEEAVVFGIRELQEECDVRATAILRKYIEHRRLGKLQKDVMSFRSAAVVGVVEAPNTREVERCLDEMLLLSKRSEEYNNFMAGKLQAAEGGGTGGAMSSPREAAAFKLGNFNRALADMSSVYVTLEEYFMVENVRKAIRIDEVVPDALTTSMVDDVFFILQNCGRRAVATGNEQSVAAAINNISNVIATDFKEALSRKIREPNLATKLFSVAGAVQKTGAEVALALNDADVSAEYVGKLKHEMEEMCLEIFTAPSERERLKASLSQLMDSSASLRQLANAGLDQLGSSITPRLRAILDSVVSVPYELSEAQYAENEVNDPWVQRLLLAVDSSVMWLQPLLTPGNYDSLVHLVVDFVSKRLEVLMSQKHFNQLGGLQLDRDVRALVAHFSSMTSRTVRDKFARLTQMATLLNLEKVSEILDFWGENAGPMTWRLAAADVKRVLSLRVDFRQESIAALRL